MVKVQLVSDLHLEFRTQNGIRNLIQQIKGEAGDTKILAIVGDLCPNHNVRRMFFEAISERPIWFVPGNHDYWHTSSHLGLNWEDKLELLQRHNEIDNVTVLMQKQVQINDTTILGCTLWSEPSENLDLTMKDFTMIPSMTIPRYRSLHSQDRKWLEQHIQPKQSTLVLTHHLPTFQAINSKYQNYDNTGYASNLDHLFQPNLTWAFGHSHSHTDMRINGCRLVSNPLGYPSERTGFIPTEIEI